MIKGVFVAVLFAIIPAVALGQEKQTLEETLRQVSKDLATLHQEVQNAYRSQAAQSPGLTFSASGVPLDYKIRITSKQSSIRAGADDNASVLTKAPQGTSLKVVDKAGEWYAVGLDKPTKGVSSGWVKASEAVPEIKIAEAKQKSDPAEQKSLSDRIYEQITESITAIRDKYKNNPYVKVTGFTVNVAVPPSVSVSFEFK